MAQATERPSEYATRYYPGMGRVRRFDAGVNTCPCCGDATRRSEVRETPNAQVWICTRCGGIFGTCYLGDSYGFVLPQFDEGEADLDWVRYYDFRTLGVDEGRPFEIGRRHGWYNIRTGRITQVG